VVATGSVVVLVAAFVAATWLCGWAGYRLLVGKR
jgi:hypothetical protein